LSLSVTSYRTRLVLHSFPTRRSSDLGGKSIRPMMADSFMTEETHTARPYFITTTNSANKLKLQNENLNKAVGFQNPLSQKFGRADRKSTRLNSSHVSISYAVFCLKKK